MRAVTEWVVVEVHPNYRRGIEACATRGEAEKRGKRYGKGSSLTYEVEEGTRYEPGEPDEPNEPEVPTDSREPEGKEES